MSQKKAIDNWKRTEYLLIKNRKKQQQIQSYRDDDHANDLWYVLINEEYSMMLARQV